MRSPTAKLYVLLFNRRKSDVYLWYSNNTTLLLLLLLPDEQCYYAYIIIVIGLELRVIRSFALLPITLLMLLLLLLSTWLILFFFFLAFTCTRCMTVLCAHVKYCANDVFNLFFSPEISPLWLDLDFFDFHLCFYRNFGLLHQNYYYSSSSDQWLKILLWFILENIIMSHDLNYIFKLTLTSLDQI